MAAVLLIACAAGVACGLARIKIWIIIPASVIFLLVTVVLDSRFGIAWSRTALISFAGLTLLQVSYLTGTLGPHYRARNKDRAVQLPELRRVVLLDRDRGSIRHQVSGHLPKQLMLRTAQMAIASELRGHFVAETLNDLPEHLRAKVAMLETWRRERLAQQAMHFLRRRLFIWSSTPSEESFFFGIPFIEPRSHLRRKMIKLLNQAVSG